MKKYNWELIIYDYNKFNNIMELCNNSQIDYCCILHNKDFENGKPKKSHVHFLVFFPFQKSLSTISKIFDIPYNNIQKVDSKIGAIRYLVHLDNKDKYQYNVEDIISTFDISSYFNTKIDKSMQEGMQVLQIIEFIDKNYNTSLDNLIKYCVDNKIYSTFRRNQNIILRFIQEKSKY